MSQDATLLEIRELEAEYEILGELGRGGMAIVYLARDRELGRHVAIKVIHAAAGADEEAIARQLTEARTVAQLQHPNVVAIYAVRRLSTLGLALVMQYVPGRTLERALREDGAFSVERTEAVLGDVAAALAYAHARGVVHRDIKPDNIFLNDETGRALVSDFGIALSAEQGPQASADMIVGTPAYMSPEQIDGLTLDGRSDVFSLGLIGFEMLAGVRPWIDDPISDVMFRQKFETLPPLSEVRPETPERLRAAVERAVAKDRDQRWASAGAFLMALTDDEWVPEDRPPEEAPRPGNRVAAHLTPRGGGNVGAATPLETVQYRRGDVPTPHQGAPGIAPRPRPRRRRLGAPALVLLLLAAGAVTAVVLNPALVGRSSLPTGWRSRLPWNRDDVRQDSLTREQAATITALRDSTSRALAAAAAAARKAADSASAAATSSADSNSARRLAIVKDSLLKAATDAKRVTPVPLTGPQPPVSVTPATTPRRTPVGPAPAPVRHDTTTRDASPPPVAAAPAPPAPTTPAPIHPPAPPIVVAGGTHTCALGSDGSIECWGANDRGQLGVSAVARRSAPTRISGDLSFTQVSAGISHSCAVARDGSGYCWGSNDFGQLGDSLTASSSAPMRVAGGHHFQLIASGATHSCGLTTDGEIWCWGRNLYGQLGNGSTQDQSAPTRVEGNARFVTLTVGWNHSCGLDGVGTAYCWGQNSSGQLGDGTTIVRTVPTAVSGGLLFRDIAAGGTHTCGITPDGLAYCWGRNNFGQLGTGDREAHNFPTKVATTHVFTAVTAGGVHSCAITRAGEAYCWGRNSYGQLGDGTTTDHETLVKVAGDITFGSVQAIGAHTCATAVGGGTYCWGDNSDGQLGNGTTTDRSVPVPVSGL